MHVTFRQLAIFNVVAEKLSFTEAANTLHLTQPAVSVQIKRLEDSVGLPLFEQLGKKIFLTAAGKELLHYSRNIFRELDEAGDMFSQMQDISRGTLSVSVATTASSFATRMVSAFLKRYPEATVKLDVTNRGTLIRQLENNEKDIVIMGKPPEHMDLVGEAFMKNPLVVIAPPDHPLAGKKQISISTLQYEPFVVREPASGTRAAMERLFGWCRISPAIHVEIADNEAIKEAVAAGLGLSVVSRHTLELDLQAGRVVTLDVEHFPIARNWYLAYRRGKRLSPIALAFKALVFEQAPRLAKLLSS
ncbi:MAG: LysR family transcriptional regulator [Ectothiorhodospiraceae bacterium]|nr:LysR family transcriptional regulator [Ectothiorhodospiraceae bacterium]